MRRPLFEARFYETYSFANALRNVIYNRFDYIRSLNEFYCDGQYLSYILPYQKYSAFHSFIEFMVNAILNDEIEEIDLSKRQEMTRQFNSIPAALEDLRPSSLPINEALCYYDLEHTSFDKWLEEREKTFLNATADDISDYYLDLRLEGPYDELVDQAVKEVFFVLFQNRSLLLYFNDMMADQVADSEIEDIPTEYQGYFESSGVLKRVAMPAWVKRAVFFRDRGMCVVCRRDLSGIMNISNAEHYDHIVPLAGGGLNDVSNVQLLCQDCNLKKSHRETITSDFYEAWYSMPDSDD